MQKLVGKIHDRGIAQGNPEQKFSPSFPFFEERITILLKQVLTIKIVSVT